MRHRNDSTKQRAKLKELHYYEDNIITKFLLSEEYPNNIPGEPLKSKSANFYSNYEISLPIAIGEFKVEFINYKTEE